MGRNFIRLRIRGRDITIERNGEEQNSYLVNRIKFVYRPFGGARANVEELQRILTQEKRETSRHDFIFSSAYAMPPLVGLVVGSFAALGAYVAIGIGTTAVCFVARRVPCVLEIG